MTVNLDKLIADGAAIRKSIDYVGMFNKYPDKISYCLTARAQYAAAVEARDKVSPEMEKIRYLCHAGSDLRFRGNRDLVYLVEQFDLCCGAILRFGEGEAWLQNLSNAQFFRQRVHDWKELMLKHMLDELKVFFQPVFATSVAFSRIRDQAMFTIKDISDKNPRPLVASISSHGLEPPTREREPHRAPLNNLDPE
jgi:hypothetical protein